MICKHCGQEFEGRKRKYCSPNCRSQANYRPLTKEQYRKYYHPIASLYICKACGQEFTSKRNAKYCSCECKNKSYEKQDKCYGHICKKCGNEYLNHRKESSYCSLECSRSRNFSKDDDENITYRCSGCNRFKPLTPDYYPRSHNTKHGYAHICKECSAEKHAEYRKTDKAKALRRASRERNIETEKRYREAKRELRNKMEKEKRLHNATFALKNRMRCLMYSSIRKVKNGRKWQELAGYSVEDLRRHIEKKFKKGMDWEKFLSGEIHIDHKIPVSAFNYTNPGDIDFKKCWSLKNLQPMWAADNIRKHDKLDKPFQPSLGY